MQSIFHNKYSYQKIRLNIFLTILFIIWPFASFLLSLFTYKNKYSRIIFVLFWALWGYSRILIWGQDSTYWTREFFNYEYFSFSDFFLLKIGSLGSESTDFIYSLFLFIMSKITNSSAILWAILSGLFTYLYIKAYKPLFKHGNRSIGDFIIFIIFMFFIPKTAFGVRFWFAVLIFLISIVRIILYNEKKYIYVLPITILIHFSFILPIIAYIFYRFTNRNRIFSYSIFIGLLLVMVLSFEFTSLANIFVDNSAFQDKVQGYGNVDDRVEYFGSKSNFLIIDKFMYTLYSLFVILFIQKNKYIVDNNILLINLSRFLLIFFIFILSLYRFLDVLDRFTIVFTLLSIIYFAYAYKIANKKYIQKLNYLLYTGLFFWGFHLLVNFVRSYSIINNKLYYTSLFNIISGDTQLIIQ